MEGFGIVFLEANACGKPVIGARSGGIPDAIVDGETGLLVEPDDEAGLANALTALLSDPARCQALGAAGRQRVEQICTWDAAHDQLFRAMVHKDPMQRPTASDILHCDWMKRADEVSEAEVVAVEIRFFGLKLLILIQAF